MDLKSINEEGDKDYLLRGYLIRLFVVIFVYLLYIYLYEQSYNRSGLQILGNQSKKG